MKRAVLKTLISWYQTTDQVLPKWLERACQKDPALAEEKAHGDQLTGLLSQKPREPKEFAGSNLSARVMRQITEENYEAEQAETRSVNWSVLVRWSGITAVACMLGIVGVQLWLQDQSPEQAGYVNTPEAASSDATTTASTTDSSDAAPLPNLRPEMLRIDDDWSNPLDKEIGYVVSDAKEALDFLTDRFIPKRYLDEARIYRKDREA